MKLTSREIKINQFYVKSILTILPELATSLRSLGSLFQQVAPLKGKDRCPVFICISADLYIYRLFLS